MPYFNYEAEIRRLLEKYPDPRKGADGILEFRQKQLRKMAYPTFGVVVDNKDPQCLGRIRVQVDAIAPGCVTPWIPIVGVGRWKESGWWQLPDIGVQAYVAFLGNCKSAPVVLGFLYDTKHLPPEHSTEKRAQSVVYQTKKHRLEIIDEEGKETILISSAQGKMRYVQTKEKGIEIINELGDIQIKCRKLIVETKDFLVQGEKKVALTSDGGLSIKASKAIKLECDKEITLKGKNVKLDASQGITSEGKQLAAEGDKVMGFDVHNMEMPAPNGTVVVPLPHPFMGKLNDKLSKDVKINGHNAAVKGSTAKHDDSMHMQLPGTIKFVNNPKKEGEVTGGTGTKVKINGKEIAVIGSTVSTCNDMGMKDNSSILAVGASFPMPTIINPKNTEEYNKERAEQDKLSPEIRSARWVKTSVKEGEEAELVAQVKDIDDGQMITFQVWKDGQDVEAGHVSYARIPCTIEGGEAKAKWKHVTESMDIPPDSDPSFFFSAHSAWCPYKKSDSVTVELKRPKLTNAQWSDTKGLVGEEVTLQVDCEEFDEGKGVTFSIYKEGANTDIEEPVASIGADIVGGKAEAVWTYTYTHDPQNILTEKPKFIFTVRANKAKEAESNSIEISAKIKVTIKDLLYEEPLAELSYILHQEGGESVEGKTDEDGIIEKEDLVPGKYRLELRELEED